MRKIAVWIVVLLFSFGCGIQQSSGTPTAETPQAPKTASAGQTPSDKEPDRVLDIKAQPMPGTPGKDVVRDYTAQFYRGELEQLHEKFSEEMKTTLTLDQLKGLHQQVVRDYGKQTSVIGEDAQTRGDYRGFVRWAKFDKTEDVIEVQWILREDDTIAGFFIRPAKK